MEDMSHPVQRTSPLSARTPWRLPQLRHRLAVPLVTVLLVATVGKLLVLSPAAGHGETAVLEGLSRHRNAVADVLATAVQVGFSNAGIVLIIGALTGWLAVLKRRPLDAAGFFIMSMLGWAAIGLVKISVERPRPELGSADPLLSLGGMTSFPSSHTGGALAIALALTLVRVRSSHRGRILLSGLLVATIVGASRVYAGAHYLSDVLAAFPVAWAGVMVGSALSNVLVPALAYGFGWKQRGISTGAHAAASAHRGAVRATTAVKAQAAPSAGSFHEENDVRQDRAA